MNLKERLLSLNLVIDNEWLDKYVELIEINKDTKKQKFKTNKHHIIPKSYFKLNKLEVDNSRENLVNLQYKDHILAHYYLINCCETKYTYVLTYAFNYMINKLKVLSQELSNDISIDEISKSHDNFCILQSQRMLGKIPWNKGFHDYTDEQRLRFSKAHIGKKDTDLTKLRKSKSLLYKNKGGCYVNNGTQSKHIKSEDLEKYLADGWVKGSLQIHIHTCKNRITIHKDDKEKRIYASELEKFIVNGWKKGRSSAVKLKVSIANKGKEPWNRGVPMAQSSKDKVSTNHKNFKGTIFMTNSTHTIRVASDEQKYYENRGYHRGMK